MLFLAVGGAGLGRGGAAALAWLLVKLVDARELLLDLMMSEYVARDCVGIVTADCGSKTWEQAGATSVSIVRLVVDWDAGPIVAKLSLETPARRFCRLRFRERFRDLENRDNTAVGVLGVRGTAMSSCCSCVVESME